MSLQRLRHAVQPFRGCLRLSLWHSHCSPHRWCREYATGQVKYERVNEALARLEACHSQVVEASLPLYAPIRFTEEGLPLNDAAVRSDTLKEVIAVLKQYIATVRDVHLQLLATFNIHSGNSVQELVKRRVLPPPAAVYQQRFDSFSEAAAESDIEATLIAATNYLPRLQLVLANGPLGEHLSLGRATVEPPEGRQSPPTEEEEEPDAETASDLDRLFAFMEDTIVEVGAVGRDFLAGSAESHPHLMQLLTNYVLAVEESYILLRWEQNTKPVPQAMQQCYEESRHHMTALLATLARFPLERTLGHLPPASPAALHGQLDQLVKFHNSWAELVNEYSSKAPPDPA